MERVLLEDGSLLLQESGDAVLLETVAVEVGPTTFVATLRNGTEFRTTVTSASALPTEEQRELARELWVSIGLMNP